MIWAAIIIGVAAVIQWLNFRGYQREVREVLRQIEDESRSSATLRAMVDLSERQGIKERR
jgi:hypothetical protein